jgi:hypothetical protein
MNILGNIDFTLESRVDMMRRVQLSMSRYIINAGINQSHSL